MAKSKCTPLKITAHLEDGRLSSANGIVMLDSILYHAWFLKNAPQVLEGIYDDAYMRTRQKYVGLPLKQLGGNRWAASKGVYEEIGQEIQHFNKRPDFFASDKSCFLAQDKGLISDSVGVYRAYRHPQLVRTLKDGKIIFFAIGHGKEIYDLLNIMVGLGKKVAMGFGFIDKWEIEDAEDDYTTEHPIYGLMRPVEVETSVKTYDAPIMMFGVRPPYWKAKNARLCYVPIPR